MNLFEVGRICIKIAGRDSGRKCVIVELLDNTFVLIDGNTRRKKTNRKHLEPLEQTISIKKGASHEDVKREFETLGLPVWETKAKQVGPRPRRKRKVKVKAEEKKEGKKEVKKKGK